MSQRRPSHLRCIFDLGKQIRFHTGTSTCFVLDLRLFQLLVDHRRRNAPIQEWPRLGGTRYRRRVIRLLEREGRHTVPWRVRMETDNNLTFAFSSDKGLTYTVKHVFSPL